MDLKYLDHSIVHRAAHAMPKDSRRFEVWRDEFEITYRVRIVDLSIQIPDKYCLVFESEEDYTMFMLRWA